MLSPLREIISPLLNVTANENCETSPTRVVSGIYLGSASHASRQQLLNNLGITAILNISKRVPNFFPDSFIYKRIEIEDSNSESLTEFFNVSNCFIDSILLTGGKVLIHCQEGQSSYQQVLIRLLTPLISELAAACELFSDFSRGFKIVATNRMSNINFAQSIAGFQRNFENSNSYLDKTRSV